MWIRLLQPFRFPEEGFGNRGRLYSPGHVREVADDVGRVILGTMAGKLPVAEEIRFDPVAPELTAGVLTTIELPARLDWMDSLALELAQGERELRWDRNILWNPSAKLRMDLVPRGLDLLDQWELCVPIVAGTADYDTRLVFVRRNETTEQIVADWRESGDLQAALDKAQVKPLLCALPADWIVSDD